MGRLYIDEAAGRGHHSYFGLCLHNCCVLEAGRGGEWGVGGVEGLEPIMMINTLCYSHADSVL